MYLPNSFEVNDVVNLIKIMRENPFATVITFQDGYPFPNHLPLLVERSMEDKIKLLGHMAKPNPQWKHFQQDQNVTVVFHGPHTYITPTWYPKPMNVPTWNYVVVHVQGRARVIDDFEGMHSILKKSVEEFEKFEPKPWKYSDDEAMGE